MWKPADPSYPPDLDPSEMKHQITFLNAVQVQDAAGTETRWLPGTPPVTRWAKIEEPRGQTLIQNGQDVTQVDVMVEIRFMPGVAASQRFRDSSGNVYVILSVIKPKGMDVKLVMPCLIIGNNQ